MRIGQELSCRTSSCVAYSCRCDHCCPRLGIQHPGHDRVILRKTIFGGPVPLRVCAVDDGHMPIENITQMLGHGKSPWVVVRTDQDCGTLAKIAIGHIATES